MRVFRAWRYAKLIDYRSHWQEGLNLSGLDSLFVLANRQLSFVPWNFRQLNMFVLASSRAHVANLSCGGSRGGERKEGLRSKEARRAERAK